MLTREEIKKAIVEYVGENPTSPPRKIWPKIYIKTEGSNSKYGKYTKLYNPVRGTSQIIEAKEWSNFIIKLNNGIPHYDHTIIANAVKNDKLAYMATSMVNDDILEVSIIGISRARADKTLNIDVRKFEYLPEDYAKYGWTLYKHMGGQARVFLVKGYKEAFRLDGEELWPENVGKYYNRTALKWLGDFNTLWNYQCFKDGNDFIYGSHDIEEIRTKHNAYYMNSGWSLSEWYRLAYPRQKSKSQDKIWEAINSSDFKFGDIKSCAKTHPLKAWEEATSYGYTITKTVSSILEFREHDGEFLIRVLARQNPESKAKLSMPLGTITGDIWKTNCDFIPNPTYTYVDKLGRAKTIHAKTAMNENSYATNNAVSPWEILRSGTFCTFLDLKEAEKYPRLKEAIDYADVCVRDGDESDGTRKTGEWVAFFIQGLTNHGMVVIQQALDSDNYNELRGYYAKLDIQKWCNKPLQNTHNVKSVKELTGMSNNLLNKTSRLKRESTDHAEKVAARDIVIMAKDFSLRTEKEEDTWFDNIKEMYKTIDGNLRYLTNFSGRAGYWIYSYSDLNLLGKRHFNKMFDKYENNRELYDKSIKATKFLDSVSSRILKSRLDSYISQVINSTTDEEFEKVNKVIKDIARSLGVTY